MACLQISKSCGNSFLGFRSDFGRKSSWSCWDLDFPVTEKKVLRFRKRRSLLERAGIRIFCRLPDAENEANGEEPPESLFMKELKKRGMTPTSLLEDSSRSPYVQGENEPKEDGRSLSTRNGVSTELERSLSNQRERSMALNSEGLEGLIPRAKLLLTIGGTFFLGFWPLILVTVAFFSALCFYLGADFVHDASKGPTGSPPYIDPYSLLEDERISQSAPQIN